MRDIQKIMLTILGEQTDPDGHVNEIEIVTEGTLSREESIARLNYRESELVGTEGAEMSIEMEDGAVRVCREGDYGSNFQFRQGQKCLNIYSTPFGEIVMGAYPSDVRYGVRECDGDIHLCYDLDMQGRYIGKNRLTVSWKTE